jgi:hypothetical protein
VPGESPRVERYHRSVCRPAVVGSGSAATGCKNEDTSFEKTQKVSPAAPPHVVGLAQAYAVALASAQPEAVGLAPAQTVGPPQA